MPEYCGVISKSPTIKAVKAKIEAEEEAGSACRRHYR
jgi:adenylyl- and sulfurtransferase ThiI